jgi:hypothetical protein
MTSGMIDSCEDHVYMKYVVIETIKSNNMMIDENNNLTATCCNMSTCMGSLGRSLIVFQYSLCSACMYFVADLFNALAYACAIVVGN